MKPTLGLAGVRMGLGTHLPASCPQMLLFKNSFLLLPGKLWGMRAPEIGFYLFLACPWSCVHRSPQGATGTTLTPWLGHVTCGWGMVPKVAGWWKWAVGRGCFMAESSPPRGTLLAQRPWVGASHTFWRQHDLLSGLYMGCATPWLWNLGQVA